MSFKKRLTGLLLTLVLCLGMALPARAVQLNLLTGIQYNGVPRENCKWSGKNALVIGDSQTVYGQWQTQLSLELGMNIYVHAIFGQTFREAFEGREGVCPGLSPDELEGMDMVLIFMGYNEMATPLGQVGDVFDRHSDHNTLAGNIQYLIDRVTSMLIGIDNTRCRIMLITPHIFGHQSGSLLHGPDVEPMIEMIKAVGAKNGIPVCDLYHNSGINETTWDIYAVSDEPIYGEYAMYELNEYGEEIGTEPMMYVQGEYYWQVRGEDMHMEYELYDQEAPCPYFSDQIHCNAAGYQRIGETVEGAIISAWGF